MAVEGMAANARPDLLSSLLNAPIRRAAKAGQRIGFWLRYHNLRFILDILVKCNI